MHYQFVSIIIQTTFIAINNKQTGDIVLLIPRYTDAFTNTHTQSERELVFRR